MNALSAAVTVDGENPAHVYAMGGQGNSLQAELARTATDAAERAAWMLVGATLVAAGFLLGLLFDRMTIWLGP
ncbi:MAG TPA: hypothetical protein VIL58_05255 [Thermoplasmata archaeon]